MTYKDQSHLIIASLKTFLKLPYAQGNKLVYNVVHKEISHILKLLYLRPYKSQSHLIIALLKSNLKRQLYGCKRFEIALRAKQFQNDLQIKIAL